MVRGNLVAAQYRIQRISNICLQGSTATSSSKGSWHIGAVLWSQAVIALMCCHCRTSLDLPFTVHLFVSFWNGLQTDVSDASDASDLRYELVQIDDLVIGT